MGRFKFAIAVVVASIALVAVIGVIVVVATPLGRFVTPSAQASGPWMGGAEVGPLSFGGPGIDLPPELQGLRDLPPSERFAHFKGVQVNLRDKNNQPVTVNVIPGVATAANASSLTIEANDGITRAYTVSDTTIWPGSRFQPGLQARQPDIANGDQVVVVTFNDSTTAQVVMPVGSGRLRQRGFGPPPWMRSIWFHR